MQRREGLEPFGAERGELEPHQTVVLGVPDPGHEAGGFGPVDQADGAVVAQEQDVGHVGDRRAAGVTVAPNGQQELVLGRGQAGGGGLGAAPAEEAAQAGAQGQEPGVGLVVEGRRHQYYRGTMDQPVSLGTTRRRMLVLGGLGLVLGGVGGVAADLVVHLVGLISNLALLHRVGFDLPNLRHYHPGLSLIGVAVAGGLVVVGLARWCPIIKGHGIPESVEAIVLRQSRVAPRSAIAKPVSAAVVMGTGGPFGAEGPIIVTGASVGSLLGQLLPVSPAERKILLAAGAAAGMAGVFATPVAAVVLAFELLLFERSLRALVPLAAATSVATALHDVLLSSRPLFPLAHPLAPSDVQLPLFAVLGLAAGLLAIVLNRGLFLVEGGFRRLPLPEWSHPVVGAVGYGLVGLAVPGSLSVGYWAITDAVNGRFPLTVALVLCVGKAVSWWIGLGSGTSGGTLAPMFLVGATMGELVGDGFAHVFPGSHIAPGAFALVGMGVTFGVGARALLTGVVFAAEVTGGYGLVVPLLLATFVAELVVEAGLGERIMTDKLSRRGQRVDFDARTDPLRLRLAGQIMSPTPPAGWRPGRELGVSVERAAPAADALALLLDTGTPAVAVTDQGHLVGWISRTEIDAELRRHDAEEVRQPPAWSWAARWWCRARSAGPDPASPR